MTRSIRSKVLFFFALILGSSFSADATEIRLKSECHCDSNLVQLGDVAEILCKDAQQRAALAAITLFPCPSGQRVVRRQEIQERLFLRSMDIGQWNFTGPRTIKLRPTPVERGLSTDQGSPDLRHGQAVQRIESAIQSYLDQASDQQAEWSVDWTFDRQAVGLVSASESQFVVTGGSSPWTGRQQFEIELATTRGVQRIPIRAVVSKSQLVVAAKATIRRGEVLHAEHLELKSLRSTAPIRDLVYRIEDLVGKEATRSFTAGQPIQSRAVRTPRLVRRGDVVTVFAVASGVRIRTQGVVSEDGGLGDLVTVRSANQKQGFTAQVVGSQKVEVYAGGTRVRPPADSTDP